MKNIIIQSLQMEIYVNHLRKLLHKPRVYIIDIIIIKIERPPQRYSKVTSIFSIAI